MRHQRRRDLGTFLRVRAGNGGRSLRRPRGNLAFGYSNRNEVASVTEPSGSPFSDQSFGYDADYNRSSWTQGSTTTSYTANTLNQYTEVTGSSTPTWNGDGGLASFGGNTYTYDALGRLTQVSNSLGIYLFSYDPLGRRVKKVDENASGAVLATYAYHYDGSEVAVEYQPSTTWTYYLGLNVDQKVMRTDGTNKQWFYQDAQGSISAVADNSGNLLEAYEYNAQGQFQITDPSGDVLTLSAIGNNILFTGREYDAETSNYFYRARYYNPTLGRFISRDPLSGAEFSQGTNLYAYCRNNYINCTDPTGEICPDFIKKAALAAYIALKALEGVNGGDPNAPVVPKAPQAALAEAEQARASAQAAATATNTTGVASGGAEVAGGGEAAAAGGEAAAGLGLGGLALSGAAVAGTAVAGYETGNAIDQIPIGNGNTIGSALTNGIAIVLTPLYAP